MGFAAAVVDGAPQSSSDPSLPLLSGTQFGSLKELHQPRNHIQVVAMGDRRVCHCSVGFKELGLTVRNVEHGVSKPPEHSERLVQLIAVDFLANEFRLLSCQLAVDPQRLRQEPKRDPGEPQTPDPGLVSGEAPRRSTASPPLASTRADVFESGRLLAWGTRTRVRFSHSPVFEC